MQCKVPLKVSPLPSINFSQFLSSSKLFFYFQKVNTFGSDRFILEKKINYFYLNKKLNLTQLFYGNFIELILSKCLY